jgi:hypothetical protein
MGDDGLCGFCQGELREAAIDHLLSPPPDRTFAIWHLLEQGYAREAVVGAVKAAARGYGREIVAGLLEVANA